jgi:uroporphyrinogen-III synthase
LGKRVLVTRSPSRATKVVQALEALGAEAIVAATTTIVDVDAPAQQRLVSALLSPADFDWILFTSANGVLACKRYLRAQGHDCRVLEGLQIAAIGDATSGALGECGLSPALQATGGTSATLAQALLAKAGAPLPRILFPRAQDGREEAVRLLQAAGCALTVHEAYASRIIEASDPAWLSAASDLRAGKLHGVAFFAPSQVAAFLQLYPDAAAALGKVEVIAAIGTTTAAALKAAGVEVHALADEPTSDGIVDKILQAFS